MAKIYSGVEGIKAPKMGADFDIATVGATEAKQHGWPGAYFPNGDLAPLGNGVGEIEQVSGRRHTAGETSQGDD